LLLIKLLIFSARSKIPCAETQNFKLKYPPEVALIKGA